MKAAEETTTEEATGPLDQVAVAVSTVGKVGILPEIALSLLINLGSVETEGGLVDPPKEEEQEEDLAVIRSAIIVNSQDTLPGIVITLQSQEVVVPEEGQDLEALVAEGVQVLPEAVVSTVGNQVTSPESAISHQPEMTVTTETAAEVATVTEVGVPCLGPDQAHPAEATIGEETREALTTEERITDQDPGPEVGRQTGGIRKEVGIEIGRTAEETGLGLIAEEVREVMTEERRIEGEDRNLVAEGVTDLGLVSKVVDQDKTKEIICDIID